MSALTSACGQASSAAPRSSSSTTGPTGVSRASTDSAPNQVGLCSFTGSIPYPRVQPDGAPAVTLQFGIPLSAASDSPMLATAYQQFNRMRCTHYQHHNVEDVSARTYYYDCVGFTSYTVRIATPRAWGEIATVVNLANGRVPSPPRFVSFFSGLPAAPQANWESVATAASLRPGDLLAWSPEIEDTENNGHSVLVLSVPKPLGKGRFAVAVMDSTATPHGPDDTRHVANPLSQRNAPLGQLPGTSSKRRSDPTAPSGLGIGVIGLDTAPSGAVSGVEWTVGTRAEQVNFAAGRPSAAPPS